jgi:hypothetical protein
MTCSLDLGAALLTLLAHHGVVTAVEPAMCRLQLRVREGAPSPGRRAPRQPAHAREGGLARGAT